MTNKVKMITVLKDVTLESTAATTQAAASRVTVETYASEALNFTVTYTTGADESSNTASVIVEGFDGTTWIQLGESTNSAGTVTYKEATYNVAGASGATAYYGHFKVDVCWQKIRFGASESGVDANKGTITVVAMVR